MKSRATSPASGGFSLVEIALALGVAIFALVAVLGIMRVAFDADSDAGRDTALAAMSTQVLDELRAVPFDALWAEIPATVTSPKPTNAPPADSTYYFTNEGTPVDSDSALTNLETVYRCVVHKTTDPTSKSIDTTQINRLFLRLEFSGPPRAGQFPTTNTQIINASISRY